MIANRINQHIVYYSYLIEEFEIKREILLRSLSETAFLINNVVK
jgi:hypothetical protein